MIKPRSETAEFERSQPKPPQPEREFKPADVSAIIEEMADRVYEQKKTVDRSKESPLPLTVSLPPWMIEMLNDAAFANKKRKEGPKNVSAIVRDCLQRCGYVLPQE